jgi:1,4-alpha-glucan branching enzyme
MRKRNKNHASHTIAAGTQVEAAFTLKCANANQAYLCGDFNGWSETNLPMIFRGDDKWEKRLTLPPGRYEYKFIVDGTWTTDPAVTLEVPNAFGTTNSVVEFPGRRSLGQIDKPR